MPPTITPAPAVPRSRTMVYYAGFVTLGLALAIVGPTLPSLAENTGSSLGQISILFTARALGGLVGSPLSGRFYDHRPGHTILATVLLIKAMMLSLIPLGNQLWLLAGIVFILGMFEIAVDIGGNTLLMWLHRERVSPYMAAMHFFFAVGAFFAPILFALLFQSLGETAGVRWTYWLIALAMLPVAAWVARTPSPAPPQKPAGSEIAAPVPLWLLLLLVAFFLLYVGAEVSFAGWIFSYAVVRELATPVNAAYLTSLFWGALMVGRLMSVPLSGRLRAQTILGGALAGCLLAVGLLLARPEVTPVLWVGAFMMGLFMAPIFPTTLTFAERRITITGRVTGWFFIGATLGGMSIPWLAGQVLDRVSPQAFLVLLAVNLLAAVTVFAVLAWLTRNRPGNPDRPD